MELSNTKLPVSGLFPHAPKVFFRRLSGTDGLVRSARLKLASNRDWYIVVDHYGYERQVTVHLLCEYFLLSRDEFGIVSATRVGEPPMSVIDSHWYDLGIEWFGFSLWHFTRFLPWLREKGGYSRVFVQCHYFGPRGIDDPCKELRKANTYDDSGRKRRDETNVVVCKHAYERNPPPLAHSAKRGEKEAKARERFERLYAEAQRRNGQSI